MALDFPSTSDFVEVSDDASLPSGTSITVSFWVKKNDWLTRAGIASHTETGNSSKGWWLDLRGIAGAPIQFSFNGADYESGTTPLNENNVWHHVAVTYDGTTVRHYVDAAAVGTNATTTSILDPAASLFVGVDKNAFGSFTANSTVAHFRVYDVVLSASEIIGDMYGRPPQQPVVNLPIGLATTEPDYSGNKNNGTRNGSPVLKDHPPVGPWFGMDNVVPFPVSSSVSSTLSGTATSSITEADIVTGGKTVILTLTGDTWVAAGTTFDAQRQNIIDGLTSAQTETTGFNAEVRDKMAVTDVVRTSSTVVTMTLPAAASFDITAQETITDTIPATALVTSGSAIVAIPTFTVDFTAAGGQLMGSIAGLGGLAGMGGIAGRSGGSAG